MPDDQIRWGLQITGRDTDLQAMRRAFKADFDPYVEDTEKGLVLWSKQLQCCATSQEAWQDAASLLRVVNSIMLQTHHSQPVHADALIERGHDGELRRTVFAVPVSISAAAQVGIGQIQVFAADGSLVPPPPPEPSIQQKWLQLALQDENLFDLLNYSLHTNSWFEVYKAIEVLEKLAGGENELVMRWGNGIKELKRTANVFHRHARGKYQPPAVEMSLHDANQLVSKLIDEAFSSKINR
jgi:hypothetical protein